MKKIFLILITLAFLVSGCYTAFMNNETAGSETYINTTQDNILIVEPYYSYYCLHNYYPYNYCSCDWYNTRFIFYPSYFSIRFDPYIYYWSYSYYDMWHTSWYWKHRARWRNNNVNYMLFSNANRYRVRTNTEVRNNEIRNSGKTVTVPRTINERQKASVKRSNETIRPKAPVKRSNETIRQKSPVKRNTSTIRPKAPVKRNTETIRQQAPVKRNSGATNTRNRKR